MKISLIFTAAVMVTFPLPSLAIPYYDGNYGNDQSVRDHYANRLLTRTSHPEDNWHYAQEKDAHGKPIYQIFGRTSKANPKYNKITIAKMFDIKGRAWIDFYQHVPSCDLLNKKPVRIKLPVNKKPVEFSTTCSDNIAVFKQVTTSGNDWTNEQFSKHSAVNFNDTMIGVRGFVFGYNMINFGNY